VLRLLYNIVFPIALLVSLPAYLARMIRRGNWRTGFGQRFGRYTGDVASRLAALPVGERTWIHAVSVGEMMLALKLIAALRTLRADLPIIVTTTTSTGRALAVERAPTDVVVLYAPLDIPSFVRRAFDFIRPARIALVEAEVWPNWMAVAARRQIPVHLLNARLSPRSEARFHRFRQFVAPIFRQLAWISVPEQSDLARWTSIGVPAEKLHCLGSIKFDDASAATESARINELRALLATAFPSELNPQSAIRNPQFLLAGSTHADEEILLAKVWQGLRPRFPSLRLLIAPRHAERTNEIAEKLVAFGLRVARRSLLDPKFTLIDPPDVLLLDSTGELRDWYPLADVVFVGKSMAASVTGGQNPAESIAAGVPTICGPHMENFADLMSALRAANGIIEVPDASRLQDRIGWLLDYAEDGAALVARGRAVLERHGGAARRNAELLLAVGGGSR
jgi:3-deoxy-D-manno-octulosonic-acid transferase